MKRRGIDYRRHRSEQVEDIDGVPYEYEFMGLWIVVAMYSDSRRSAARSA